MTILSMPDHPTLFKTAENGTWARKKRILSAKPATSRGGTDLVSA
jgi:hypothetical protein